MGILQARILVWVAMPSSRISSQPREPRSPALQADSLSSEPPGKPKNTGVSSLSLLQKIFLTQKSTQGFFHCRMILYQLSYQGSPTFQIKWNTSMLKVGSGFPEWTYTQVRDAKEWCSIEWIELGPALDTKFKGLYRSFTLPSNTWPSCHPHPVLQMNFYFSPHRENMFIFFNFSDFYVLTICTYSLRFEEWECYHLRTPSVFCYKI